MEPTADLVEVWPLFGLVLTTPRVQLRPMRDQDLPALIENALAGVHAPDYQPFANAWTSEPASDIPINTAKFHWGHRANLQPADWAIEFGVHVDGDVIGSQGLMAKDFAKTRSVSTGSWLALKHHGKGLGKEMRRAVLMFAFDYLGATEARAAAWTDNGPCNGVSRSLGYQENGIQRMPFGDSYREEQNYRMAPEQFRRPEWELRVDGYTDKVKAQLGLLTAQSPSE